MMDDFVNFTQEKAKRLILEYQKTGDPETFSMLLAKYDRYLAKVLHSLRRTWISLENEDLQELYHNAIIGFSKAIKAFKPHVPAKMICMVIKAYIKSEFRQVYSYRKREINMSSLSEGLEEAIQNQGSEIRKLFDRLDVDFILSSGILTENEREALDGRYLQGYTSKELSARTGASRKRTQKRLYEGLKKLKNAFRE